MSLARRGLAEFIGTALLLTAVVGSGIAAQRLSTDPGLQLFEAAAATGAALAAIILAVGPVSGAHLNPAVSITDALLRGLAPHELVTYIGAQVAGGVAGTLVANVMFGVDPLTVATTQRTGGELWLGEAVATFGLLVVIFGMARSRSQHSVAFAVGAYIAAAYFFTSSTSFANPAGTVARSLTDTFSGIAPRHVTAFVAAQLVGAAAAIGALRLLYPDRAMPEGQVVVPHPPAQEAPG